MKIEIIEVDYQEDSDAIISLRECGFKVGDLVKASGRDCLGRVLVRAIRNTDMARVGRYIGVMEHEYKVVEE